MEEKSAGKCGSGSIFIQVWKTFALWSFKKIKWYEEFKAQKMNLPAKETILKSWS